MHVQQLELEQILERVQDDFDEKVIQRRNITMDVFESLLGDSIHWPILRKKLLGFFGQSGLQGDLDSIISNVRKNLSQARQDTGTTSTHYSDSDL